MHDLGRVGVENGIWDKPERLATSEWEKVRLHPLLDRTDPFSDVPPSSAWVMSPRVIMSDSTGPDITARRPRRKPPGGDGPGRGRCHGGPDPDRPHRARCDLEEATRTMEVEAAAEAGV